MVPNGHNQYLKTQVLTASQEQLVLMLYDGAIRFCETAKKAWEDKCLEVAHKALLRSQNIVLELTYALDKEQGGELAENMASLYTYCYTELVNANLERSPERVDGVQKILRELREAWAEAMEKVGASATREDASGGENVETAPKGKVLAQVPIAKMAVPREEAEERPRISVQG